MKKFDFNNWSMEFLKFIKKEELYTNIETSNKSLLADNQIVVGVYVCVYDKC